MSEGAAIAGVVIGLYGASEQKKAHRAQEKSDKIKSRIAALQNAKNQRKSVAAMRRERARSIALAESGGVSGGSAAQGAVGSITTQGATAVGFSRQLQSLDRQRFSALSSANKKFSNASTANSLASLAGSSAGYLKDAGY